MKPRELIINSIEQTLVEPLSKLGFTFSKSTLTFKRKLKEFVQTISFQLNRHNEENTCAEFWTSYSVSSKEYSRWHKAEFGTEDTNDHLSSEMDWNIKGMAFPVIDNIQELHFQIIAESHREKVLGILKENVINVGIPYLDRLSNWENAAHDLVDKDWFHDKAADFFLIASNKEKARWALQQGLDYWDRHPKASFPESKDELHKRIVKYFS